MHTTNDMTRGKPVRLLVAFAVPIMISYVLQQLYGVVDGAVVGRLIGVYAFASVGAAGFLSWMVMSIILGLTQGFGALFSQRFGAKDAEGLRKAIAMALLLSLLIGGLLTAIGIGMARPILVLLHTPAALLEDALTYLYWLLGGTLITVSYNLAASLLRALGNSKTPLYAVLCASAINIALDLLLVAVFHMGVEGVAIATVIAQLFSLLVCVHKLRHVSEARLRRADFAVDGPVAAALLRMGMPLAFRDAVISVGGMAVQWVINGYGMAFIAGTNATRRYYGLLEVVGGGMEGAVATFVGQNYGAGHVARIGEGMRAARRLLLLSSVVIAGVVALLGRTLIGLMVAGPADEVLAVVQVGTQNLLVAAACLPALYMLTTHRAALQGMGNALVPMLSGFVELALRMLSVFVLPPFVGVWGVYLADGIGWIGAALLLVIAYQVVYQKSCRLASPEP